MPSASVGDIHIGENGAWKVPGARWPAIVLAIVFLDAVCFYAFSLFAMETTHFVWMSVNAGALVFGPVINLTSAPQPCLASGSLAECAARPNG
jgi:hypothetical protein